MQVQNGIGLGVRQTWRMATPVTGSPSESPFLATCPVVVLEVS